MPTYSGRIVREQGGSVLTVASGGSVQAGSGGVIDISAGRTVLGTLDAFNVGVGQTAACVASSKLKLATDVAASAVIGVAEVMDFGNGVKFFIARTENAPSAAGSPGSLILRLPGTGTPSSVVDLYIKRGDNDPASGNWVAFQTTASAG